MRERPIAATTAAAKLQIAMRKASERMGTGYFVEIAGYFSPPSGP